MHLSDAEREKRRKKEARKQRRQQSASLRMSFSSSPTLSEQGEENPPENEESPVSDTTRSFKFYNVLDVLCYVMLCFVM